MWSGEDKPEGLPTSAPVVTSANHASNSHSEDEETTEMDWEKAAAEPPKPRGKPEVMAQKLAAARIQANLDELAAERKKEEQKEEAAASVKEEEGGVLVQATAKPATPKKKAARPKPRKKPSSLPTTKSRKSLKLSEPTTAITDAEYDNLEALMKQFCRVPLLAEFSRPVSLLHPEVSWGIFYDAWCKQQPLIFYFC